MQNFTFHNPTKIIFGDGTVEQIGEEAAACGKKLMMVYGVSSIKKSGVYDRVLGSLKSAGLQIVEYSGIKPNPLLSQVREAIGIAKKEKVDFMLGVGGGSAIDATKGIAAGAKIDGDVWDFYTGKASIKESLPVLSILTIPATGTEMNGGTVLTNDETKQKFGFIDPQLNPVASILDPTLTFTIPPDYTAYSAVDAISHLIEGYFTQSEAWTPIQDSYVEGLVKSIISSIERVMKDPKDYEGRATFMWAATLAWNGLGTVGIGNWGTPMHMLEHPLSGLHDIAHGAGLSITIPAWLTWKSKSDGSKIAQFARNVFDIDDKNDLSAAVKGIDALKGWFEKIGSPVSFAQANIPESDIPKLADYSLELVGLWGMSKEDYTKEVITELLKLCV